MRDTSRPQIGLASFQSFDDLVAFHH